jgi:hypothetical protein
MGHLDFQPQRLLTEGLQVRVSLGSHSNFCPTLGLRCPYRINFFCSL